MGARENECQFTRIVKTQLNSENFMCKMSFCETDIYFLKLQGEIFFDVITDLTNYIYSP